MAYSPAQILLAVQALRPGLTNNVDFELAVTDATPFISVWNRADVTRPTQAEIEAVDIDALLASRTVLAQDLMSQFTVDDAAKIQAAISTSAALWLLWSAMQTQKDPMAIASDRFRAGWSALVQVLGQPRMAAIAAALGVTIA
jgi:hypothetical protein